MKNLWHNKLFSLVSAATMAACIFLFGVFFALVINFQNIVKEAESSVAVTVFFEDGISDKKIEKIGKLISKRVEVSEYKFISADEAWENFKEEYFGGDTDAAEGFADDNPLANSACYEIYLNDVSMQAALVEYLEGLDGVKQVNKSEIAANTLSDFNRLIGYVSAGIIIILLGVAVFLINNTVTVGIAVRSEEIAIMKLIGATNLFIRAPFMVEGVMIGLIGSAVPLIVLFFMYQKIIVYVSTKFRFLSDVLTFLPVSDVFRVLVPVALILGVGIGFLGSILTIRRHLDV
jgi:cell division transport system permease protein